MRLTSCLVVSFLYTISVFSQQLDSTYLNKTLRKAVAFQEKFQPAKSLVILNELLHKAKAKYTDNSNEIGRIYYHIATSKLDLAEYDAAKNYIDLALGIFKLSDSISIELADTHMLLGIYYDYRANYEKALAYYKRTKSLYLKLYSPNHYKFGYLYNNMGICIFYQGDIERALAFFNKALAVTIESLGKQNKKISRDIVNSSQCYSRLRKSKIAIDKLSYALNVANKNMILNSFIGARIHHSLALAYFELKDYTQSLSHLEQAYKLRLKHLPPYHDEIASTHFMMANVYLKLKDREKAKTHFFKAQNIFINTLGKDHPDVAIVHTSLATLALEDQDLPEALSQINKALHIFQYDENISPTEKDNFNINILKALDIKARILYTNWKLNQNILQLKNSNRIYTDIIYILNNFRKKFKEELSKEILASNFFHIFDDAIEVSFDLFEATQQQHFLETAFERSEYSSSFVLLEGRRNANAKTIAEIPDSLLQQEQKLRLDITFWEKKKREENQQENKDEYKIAEIAGLIFDLKEQLYQQVQQLENIFPRYNHHKYHIHTVSVKELQQHVIEEDQTLVEYFIGEANIFAFIITQDSFVVQKIEKTFPLESWIKDLRLKITAFQYPFNLDYSYHESLVEQSEGLYWELINPIEQYLKQRIIIIPSGILAEIPFDFFIKNAAPKYTSYAQHNYLLNEYSISYCYSATLLNEMINNRTPQPSPKAIAFAPSFKDFGQSSNLRDIFLLPLKFNTPEVEDIGRIIDAKKVIGKQATEDYFVEQANKYSILHFATHAIADQEDGDFSFLAFSEVHDTLENELLFVKDIYNIPLSAEMVTLSACQTNFGEHRKGEGIISLARSFSFSGTCNINTSLWNVNDLKTAQLMSSFYKNIKKGNSKDQAMRQAKLKLIRDQDITMHAHPFFWGAMIPIGDMRPIKTLKSFNFTLWGAIIIGIFSSIWFLWKRRLRNSL